MAEFNSECGHNDEVTFASEMQIILGGVSPKDFKLSGMISMVKFTRGGEVLYDILSDAGELVKNVNEIYVLKKR